MCNVLCRAAGDTARVCGDVRVGRGEPGGAGGGGVAGGGAARHHEVSTVQYSTVQYSTVQYLLLVLILCCAIGLHNHGEEGLY